MRTTLQMSLLALAATAAAASTPAHAMDTTTTESGGGTVTTKQGTTRILGQEMYGQQKTYSTSSTPGSNPHDSQSSAGAGFVFRLPEAKRK